MLSSVGSGLGHRSRRYFGPPDRRGRQRADRGGLIVDPDVGINPQRQSDVAMARQGLRHFRRDPGSLQAGNKQVSIGMEVGVAVLQEVGLLKLNAACLILLVTF